MAQQKIVELLARSKFKWLTTGPLGGDWNHVWYAKDSSNWSNENRCRVMMYSLGKFAAGIWEQKKSRFLVTARLGEDNLVTGTWRELKPNGYRGSWIASLSLTKQYMSGMYLGNSDREPNYGVGEWIWWRFGQSKPKLPVLRIQVAERVSSE
jgi:hypothetical protein